jgi:hypothetical protein
MCSLEEARAIGDQLMSYHIPFVNFSGDWRVARTMYPSAALYRIALQSPAKTPSIPSGVKLWVDAGTDALDNWPFENNENYRTYFRRFSNTDRIANAAFQARPDKNIVTSFVDSILSAVLERMPSPEWVSIPQMSYVDGVERNRINKMLADSTQRWKAKANYRGKLILPIILTNQRQLNKKTERNSKIALAAACLDTSGADGVWVVDSSLNDQDAKENFESVRFPGVIRFHQELNAALPQGKISVAGPYWGLNLILWGRGIASFAAIGVGKTSRYRVPGGMLKQGVTRIAIPPLRRLVTWKPELKSWLSSAQQTLARNDPSFAEFSSLIKQSQLLRDEETARLQIGKFYGEWLKRLEVTVPQSRSLALYQDFSNAYVLGKSLPDIPSETGPARSPSRIAEQFMGNCL